MSRETDSSYPSGNESDEPKTETTLTTRIRINIPGSRPIPPVVMRKPVSEADAPADAGRADPPAAPPGPPAAPEAAAPAAPRETSSWFAPRKAPGGPPPLDDERPPPAGHAPPQAAPRPGAPDTAPPAPGGPFGTPPDGIAVPPGAGRPGAPGSGVPEAGAPGRPGQGVAGAHLAGSGGPDAYGSGPGEPAAPPLTGPTTGPVSGDMPLLPPEFRVDGQADGPAAAQPPSGPPPVLTPPPGHGVGDTAPGGIPAVPADTAGPGDAADADASDLGPPEPPAPATPQPAAPARPPARKKRSKLVLLGVAAAGVLGIAYGAGLLLNHADVPNGTTVLGVDIGGSSKAEAVATLEQRLGERATAPLTLEAQGRTHELKPSVAGLSLDTETTVASVTGREYNPVAVIGSLVGGEHPAEPVFTVDDEKLRAVLADLTGDADAETGATITFEGGEPVVDRGGAGERVDPERAAEAVEQAYRERAATGAQTTVTLPVSEQGPQVSDAEFERALREFAEPAMSGLVTVRAGTTEISFSPERSLPKFLSMRSIESGKLVDHYDLEALEDLYGSTFDGVLVARGDGSRTPVTPQDVVSALRPALTETDPARRIGVIPLDGA
ncbi:MULTISPECIES: peptidoglycan binding domain-containing protein [Streptomyces]|uniref:peptidoglycan binding domain-containing protein n=1 Tax=Streptomyces TaxID=1883 RepID=UPI0022491483|nr:peptidoglycan binding domain-containing protein [Streptomyces sp. JHD 1]MCX2969683.1 peptidoglycan binding domain-containing protein [Streptomyces sp. JHD 1]